MLFGYANTGVNHFDSEDRIMARSLDEEISAIGHGVFGIDEEVKKDLLELSGIPENRGNAGAEFSLDADFRGLELMLQ